MLPYILHGIMDGDNTRCTTDDLAIAIFLYITWFFIRLAFTRTTNISYFNLVNHVVKQLKKIIYYLIIFEKFEDRHFIKIIFLRTLILQHFIIIYLVILNNILGSRIIMNYLIISYYLVQFSVKLFNTYTFFLKIKKNNEIF